MRLYSSWDYRTYHIGDQPRRRRLKNEFTEDEKRHNLMRWLISSQDNAFKKNLGNDKTSIYFVKVRG